MPSSPAPEETVEPPTDIGAVRHYHAHIYYDPATGIYGTHTENIGSLKLPAYTLVDASAGLKFDNGLELVAYVKNIFNVDPKLYDELLASIAEIKRVLRIFVQRFFKEKGVAK